MDEYRDENINNDEDKDEGSDPEDEESLSRRIAETEQLSGPDHFDLVPLLEKLAAFYLDRSRPDQAEPLYLRVLALFEQRYGEDQPDLGQVLERLAEFYQRYTDRLDQAEAYYLRALNIYELHYAPGHAAIYAVLNRLVVLIHVYTKRQRCSEAEALCWRLLDICEQDSPHFDRQLSELIIQRDIHLSKLLDPWSATPDGARAERTDKPDPVIKCALDCLHALDAVARQLQHADSAAEQKRFQQQMAQHYRQQGEEEAARLFDQTRKRLDAIQQSTARARGEPYRQAIELYQRILAWEERHLGLRHLAVAGTARSLATIATSRKAHKEAEELYRRAAEIYEAYYGPEHFTTTTCQRSVEHAQLLQEMQETRDARVLAKPGSVLNQIAARTPQQMEQAIQRLQSLGRVEEAGRIRERANQLKERQQAVALNQQALQARQRGDYQEAETCYKQTIDLYTQLFGPRQTMTVMQMDGLASLYIDMERLAEAEELYRRVAAIREKQPGYGPAHLATGRAYGELGHICQQQQRWSEAEELYQRALPLFLQQCGRDNVYTVMLVERYAKLLLDTQRIKEARQLEHDPLAFLSGLSSNPTHLD